MAFFVSLVSGAWLVWDAPTTSSKLVCLVYACAISLLFGVSALFHRHTWGPVGRRRMRRADHSTIFIAIAGSYTAVAGIALTGWARTAVLLHRVDRRRARDHSPPGVARRAEVGHRPALRGGRLGRRRRPPPAYRALGPTGFVLLLIGGLAYSAGAVVYALKKPDPVPGVFGYHEVFHACTIVGAVVALHRHRRVRAAAGRQ